VKHALKGLGVSITILVAGIASVFYAILVAVAIETLIDRAGIDMTGLVFYVVLFATVLFTNIGTYAFTTEIPMHLTRTKNTGLQVLAHVLSSTTATFVKTLELSREPILKLLPINDVSVASLIIAVPFIIIVYTVTQRSKQEKRARNHLRLARAHANIAVFPRTLSPSWSSALLIEP
jgi:hypothetical protein